MADFAAVLKKTLDGLGDTTPAMRARVYDKARDTINTKLAALVPQPPAAVAERQRQSLEEAIASVERGFAVAAPSGDPLDELESVFSSIDAQRQAPPPLRAPPPAPPPAPAPKSPVARPLAASLPMPRAAGLAPLAVPPQPAEPRRRPAEPTPASFEDEATGEPDGDDGSFDNRWTGEPAADFAETRPRRRGLAGRIVAALLVLALLGGAGYAAWLKQDDLKTLVASLTGPSASAGNSDAAPDTEAQAPEPNSTAATPEPAVPAAQPSTPAGTDTVENAAPPAAQPPAQQDTAAASNPAQPAPTQPAPTQPTAPPAAPATPPKFTQRLTADGGEVDAGAGSGAGTVGEGTSVAELTPPQAPAVSGAAPAAPPAEGAPAAGTPPSALPAVAVGQRAIFYEERTNVSPASAETGSIVWSTVQESPGGDLPAETAIRAEATIPGKDMQLRMTIRRNGDRTLPASHIIEIIFLTPGGNEGGGVDNVLRVSMKNSEQDPGSPLLGNSVKIADGYFLVALDDGAGQIQANLNLLRQQSWIDVPVVYKSGRRALFTMEKGIPGEKAFDAAIKAWQPGTGE